MEWWKKALIVMVALVLLWVFFIGPMFDDHSQVQSASLGKANNNTNQTNATGSVAASQQRGNSNVYAPIIIHSGDTRTYNYPDSSRQTGTGYTTGQRGAGYSSVPPPDSEATPVTARQSVEEELPITAVQAVDEETPITAVQAVDEETPITASVAVGGDESSVPNADAAEESGLDALISALGGGSGSDASDAASSEEVVSGNDLGAVEPAEGSNIWSDLFSGSGDAASGIDGSGDGLGGGDDDGIGGLGGLGGGDDGIFGGLGGGDDDGIGGLGGLGSDDDGIGGLGGLGDDDGFGGFGDSDSWGGFEGGDFDPGDL